MRSSAPYRGVDDVTPQTLPMGRCLNSACVCDATHGRAVATVCGRRQPSKASTIVCALLVTCALMYPLNGVTASHASSMSTSHQTPLTQPVARLVFRAQQVNTIATRTVSSHTGACSNVTRCLADPQCKQCLNAINSTVGFPHSVVEYIGLDNLAYRAYEIKFFQT